MKTLNEIIQAIECCISAYCSHPEKGDCPYLNSNNNCEKSKAKEDILFYLKEYQFIVENCADVLAEKYPSENTPLTWDEIKQMEGKPVWMEDIDNGKILYGFWDIVGFTAYYNKTERIKFYRSNDRIKHNLGITWQAYRKERKI